MTANAQTAPKKPQTAITPTREENFPEWYQAVVKAADMAESSPVRGCYTIKPYGFAMWENAQRILDGMIKEENVQNAYFPLLIPLSFISKEAEHIDGFAKECAVVTHHRLEKGPDGKLVPAEAARLTEPFVIRPTSETIIGETLSSWIQSYRDLPYKLNQWCNVMRWEMRPRVFLRTSEFLWQEGHNCFETAAEARADALRMLDVYVDFLANHMAIPGLKGEKTPDERFPGAIATYTYESMMQDGKALQSCTSHDLGQTFSKSCNIKYQTREGGEAHAWTTSWGLSTRTIGGLIMNHADDDGLIMPPAIAPQQAVIIPVLKGDNDARILEYGKKIAAALKAAGFRAHLDARDERTPNKMWDAIKKGIPVRIEIGAREVETDTLTHVRRDLGRDSKATTGLDAFIAGFGGMMKTMQDDMLAKATARMRANIADVSSVAEIKEFFAADKTGFTRIDYEKIGGDAYETVRKEFSLSSRCLPFEDEGKKVIIARSY